MAEALFARPSAAGRRFARAERKGAAGGRGATGAPVRRQPDGQRRNRCSAGRHLGGQGLSASCQNLAAP